MSATHWEKFFKRFAKMKRNLKGTTKIRIHENYVALQLCFGIMDKNYLEEITRQDCRNLCGKIYCVPKRWSKKIQSTPILNLLVKNSSCDTIGRKTIKEYLTTFKEFMRYAVKEEIIQNSMNDFIDMPIKNDSLVREPFTPEELHKIFDPKLYPDPHNRKNSAKFWVTIIALYHGCRLNEACQLDVNDVVREKNIPCFSINSNSKDKSLKTDSSLRTIPIHPKLIDMGFLYYVEYQRKTKKKSYLVIYANKKEGYMDVLCKHGLLGI